MTFLAAALVLLALVTKAEPTRQLTSLGHSTVRAISRGRLRIPSALAFLVGLVEWACILFLVIAVVSYLYSLSRAT